MTWTDLSWLKSLVLPPGVLLLAIVGGIAAGRRGRALAAAAALVLLALSLPLTARWLNVWLDERIPASAAVVPRAIIVLAGDYRYFAPEFGEATVGERTLARLRQAAVLQRRTGLPILVSGGGTPPEITPGMAETMRIALERDFGVPVRWVEPRSRNTYENAVESRAILAAEGISSAYLVTHASHMPRSVRAFAAAGLEVTPAPTGGPGPWSPLSLGDLLPDSRALERSAAAVHEIAGLVWYEGVIRWRGAPAP